MIATTQKTYPVKLSHWGECFLVIRGQYALSRRPRIDVESVIGETIGHLTVCLGEDKELARDEIYVKTWSENKQMAEDVLKRTDYFEDTGRRVPTGFVEASVWKVKIWPELFPHKGA